MESFYEIETTCKRAARASGFSWGVAEEIGKAIRSLELMGLPGLKTFHDYLQYSKENELQKLFSLTSDSNQSDKIFCPIVTSIAILDDCKKLFQNDQPINFSRTCYPLLLIPMINRSSNIIGRKIQLSFEDFNIILNFNETVILNKTNSFPTLVEKFSIKSIEREELYTKDEYKHLYELSLETFVEESEGKLSGAGAGLTDND